MAMRPLVWPQPASRYYYDWYTQASPEEEMTDPDIKSIVVDRLRENPHSKDDDIRVDVEHGVVVLSGDVSSPLAKRAGDDDAWDVRGVKDVSNQLEIRATG
jgi:osmotically-inducible protein OsmY